MGTLEDLLRLTTERLLADMRAGEENPDWTWDETQKPPYVEGDRVIVPKYDDGYMSHPEAQVWIDGERFRATSPGDAERAFDTMEEAVTYAITP